MAIPGQGGINRGRADAAMIWGEETPGRTDQFDPRVLPPSKRFDPESTAVMGIGATAPDVDPKGEGSSLSETGAGSGRAAWRRRLSPSHRKAVRSFFGSPGASTGNGAGATKTSTGDGTEAASTGKEDRE